MDFDYDQVRRGFAEQSRVFLDLVDETEDLSTPTGLGDWDCAVLVAHVSTAIEMLFRWQGPLVDHGHEVDVVAWYDMSDAMTDQGNTMAEANTDFTIRYAAERTHQQLRDLVVAAFEKAEGTVKVTAPEAPLLIPSLGFWARFDQGVATRVVELTVHGLDLASAIGSSIEASPAALSIVAAILDERLEGDRPADLLDDRAWVLAATGRTEHNDPRLPVLH